jgi:hypothetical protein
MYIFDVRLPKEAKIDYDQTTFAIIIADTEKEAVESAGLYCDVGDDKIVVTKLGAAYDDIPRGNWCND